MPRDRRRVRLLAGWLVFGLAEAGLHLSGTHLIALYSLFMMLATGAGTALHARAALRSTDRARTVWSLTAIGLAGWAFAELSVGVPALLTGAAGGRGRLANLLNLGALGFAVAAMLVIPAAPRTAAGRTRLLLDGIVAASSLLGMVWILVLAPMTRIEGRSAATFDLAYPVLAVAVLAVALVLLAGQPIRRTTALSAITGGVIVVTLTLLIEVLGQVAGAAWLRPWVLGGYVAAAALLAIAPLAPLPAGPARVWPPTTPAAGLVPYLPMAGLIGLMVMRALAGERIDPPVIWSGVTMVSAVLARQFIALRINNALARDLEAERLRLADQAVRDTLTGLPNRALLNGTLAELDADAARTAALLMIDLDGFKAVNDTLGHAAGDQLLIAVAERLRRAAGPDAFTARLGGDEFAVMLPGGGLDSARELAEDLLRALAEPLTLAGRPATVRASIGIAERTEALPAERLLHNADLALYDAKHHDKGRYRLFDRDMSAAVEAQRSLEADLARALVEGQFRLVYQSIVDLTTGETHTAEALLRWQHPRRGLLSPDTFLPAAADAGLLPDIDRWVLTTAAAQLATWRITDPAYTVSVNMTAPYLAAGTVLDDVRRVLREHVLPGSALTVEVTETSLIADLDEAARTLRDLRALGVRVALDDFGVGYSSLTYLRKLPVDKIKIDRSFIRDLHRDAEAATLVSAVLALVHGLGLDCVAEGVEEPEQAAYLVALQCAQAQGYLFARPTPPEQLLPAVGLTVAA